MSRKPPQTGRKILGGAVRRLRESYGIKQDTLAQDCGIHPAYLSNIERGKKDPSPILMRRIADRLGVDLDDITYVVLAEDREDREAVAS